MTRRSVVRMLLDRWAWPVGAFGQSFWSYYHVHDRAAAAFWTVVGFLTLIATALFEIRDSVLRQEVGSGDRRPY